MPNLLICITQASQSTQHCLPWKELGARLPGGPGAKQHLGKP